MSVRFDLQEAFLPPSASSNSTASSSTVGGATSRSTSATPSPNAIDQHQQDAVGACPNPLPKSNHVRVRSSPSACSSVSPLGVGALKLNGGNDQEPSDDWLPPHERRRGRIESLDEFQQRVEQRDSHGERPPVNPFQVQIDISSDSSDGLLLQRNISKRSLSQYSNYSNNSLAAGRRALKKNYYRRQFRVLSFLMLLGVIAGPLSYSIKFLQTKIYALKQILANQAPSEEGQYFMWTLHTLLFTVFALLWTCISPVASGSGISQMKSILTGIDPRMYLPGYFEFVTLVAKIGGLVSGIGAGLIIGAEGAFVHIMSIVTHYLLRSKLFRSFGERLETRLQLLAAACAVGVSSTFSAPIGGVLFSMEVTATYYLMSNYLKAFVSSVSGAMMLQVVVTLTKNGTDPRASVMLDTEFPKEPFSMWELSLFTLMGCLLGTIGSFVIFLIRIVAQKRKELRASEEPLVLFFVRWVDPILTAFATASVTFWPGAFARQTPMEHLELLFRADSLPKSWLNVSKYFSLSMVFASNALFLPLCLTLAIPSGVWLPTFTAGGAFGRLYGEFVDHLFPSARVIPGAYAIAGAAAFAGATTRTVSAAVIAIELTGAVHLILPIFCATLAAIGFANLWQSRSVYDTLLVVSGLPYLPLLDFDTGLTAEDVMEPVIVYLTKVTSVAKLLLAVQRMPVKDIPVVQNEDNMKLLGVVSQSQIRRLLTHFYTRNHLQGLEVDLGEKPAENASADVLSFRHIFKNDACSGLNGQLSFDHVYSALSTEFRAGNVEGLPFLMDDDRMLKLMSRYWPPYKKEKLFMTNLAIHNGSHCRVKPLAMTIVSATTLEEIHMIFTMLRCDHCYVCDEGELKGVVTTKSLLHAGTITNSK